MCSEETVSLGRMLAHAHTPYLQVLCDLQCSTLQTGVYRNAAGHMRAAKFRSHPKDASNYIRLLCNRKQLTGALYTHHFGQGAPSCREKSHIRCALRQTFHCKLASHTCGGCMPKDAPQKHDAGSPLLALAANPCAFQQGHPATVLHKVSLLRQPLCSLPVISQKCCGHGAQCTAHMQDKWSGIRGP